MQSGAGAMGGGYAVGIDLGTSNTVAIVRWPDGRTRPVLFDGQPVLPSAVYLDHNDVLQVGRDAQRMAQLDPGRFEPNPKRRIDEEFLLLGDRELPVTEVLAAPLRTVARAVSDTVGRLPPAVITCPAAWGTLRRTRLQEAATAAGWPPVHLMSEPIAAARYFTETLGRPVPTGGVLAVFDFGGGTVDVALVRNDGAAFTVVGSSGAEDLGGLDIDAALVDHLGHLLAAQHPQVWAQIDHPTDELARRNRRMFWDDVRAAKEMLSRTTSAPVPVPGVSASLHVTREELERVATPLVLRATDQLATALKQAGLGPAQLTAIFLVGGTSRVPLVSRMLHTGTGIAPTVLEQPELPVAEGAVAGSAALAAPAVVSGPPSGGVPVSAIPMSNRPVSGQPVSGQPVSGHPVSGHPVSGHPHAAPVVAAPPGPFAPVPGQRPGGPVWAAPVPPPAPVPPKRYAAWPWLLGIVLVITTVCGGGYWLLRDDDEPPLTAERTIAAPNLAPTGLRQALVTPDATFTVGQLVDGRIAVTSLKHGSGTPHTVESTVSGQWSGARAHGGWVAVFAQPPPDGTRTVLLAEPAAGRQTTVVLAKGEDIAFRTATAGRLGFLIVSTASVRSGEVGPLDAAPVVRPPVPLPPGAVLLSTPAADPAELDFVDASGAVWRFTGGTPEATGHRTPAGHPPALVHLHLSDRKLYVAENRAGYQVFANGGAVTGGPADRVPVWIGPCGAEQARVCVIDQVPGDPASRHLAVVDDGGLTRRAPVPQAVAPLPAVPGVSASVYDYLLVPTADGTVSVDDDAGVHTFPGELRLLGGVDAVLMPTRPAGAPADWATAPSAVPFGAVNLSSGKSTDVGPLTVRPGSCGAAAGRLACATADAFQIWRISPD